MRCHWQELLNLLPVWLKDKVDKLGKDDMQELRLRLHAPPEMKNGKKSIWLERIVTGEDISFCLNMATRYSPWTSSSITSGFITAAGGHRIGICGECVYDGKQFKNMNQITSICIRVAREFQNISAMVHRSNHSILIIGCPGCGKTTFLRDLIRQTSNQCDGAVAVVDERRELFPCSGGKYLFERGKRTDVLSGCKKATGLEMALRTMGPSVIAVDEITEEEDCTAICRAAWCGVRLIATAHAGNVQELLTRKIYQPILNANVFEKLIVMRADKTWREETLRL